jgi:hypothetical protein
MRVPCALKTKVRRVSAMLADVWAEVRKIVWPRHQHRRPDGYDARLARSRFLWRKHQIGRSLVAFCLSEIALCALGGRSYSCLDYIDEPWGVPLNYLQASRVQKTSILPETNSSTRRGMLPRRSATISFARSLNRIEGLPSTVAILI